MLRVGLTGGIGSGKSEVARLLAGHGAVVVDSDRLARQAVEPGSRGLAEVAAAFGTGVLAADGSLDRSALAAVVFADPAERARLEAIVHPRVRALAAEAFAAAAAAAPDAIVVNDVPLLVEAGLAGAYDVVVVVAADPAVQLRRLVEGRGMSEADARARIAAQATPEQRLAVADLVIGNDGSLADLAERVAAVWAALRKQEAAARG
ncbi:MAG: dephospho-CoA kinase [Frankiaceae bacterium]